MLQIVRAIVETTYGHVVEFALLIEHLSTITSCVHLIAEMYHVRLNSITECKLCGHFVCTISSKISGSATFACLSWSFTPKYLDADVVPPQTRLTCYELSPHQVYTHRNLDTSVLKRDDSSALTLHLRGLMISSELGTDTSVG